MLDPPHFKISGHPTDTHTLCTTSAPMRAHLVTALPLSGWRSSLVSVSGWALLVLERRSSCTRGLLGGWLSGVTRARWLRTESLVSLCLRLCSRNRHHKQCAVAIDYAIGTCTCTYPCIQYMCTCRLLYNCMMQLSLLFLLIVLC